jgi:riboflavin biosynthesis pyrimidine reductase
MIRSEWGFEMRRPYVVVHNVASVDGRVSLGASRTGFDDVADERWQAIWASDTSLDDSVRALVAEYDPQVLLEGSGSFVREGADGPPLPPVAGGMTDLHSDFLPSGVVSHAGRQGWFCVVDGRGRVRAGIREFPGWDGWHTLHLVCESTPPEYLAFLRSREIPYLVAGLERVDLTEALRRLRADLGVKRIVCTAGSRLTGALLRAGLVDEVSLVFLPALIGGTETPTLFRGRELGETEWPCRLDLVSVCGESSGRVRVRYRVIRGEDADSAAPGSA